MRVMTCVLSTLLISSLSAVAYGQSQTQPIDHKTAKSFSKPAPQLGEELRLEARALRAEIEVTQWKATAAKAQLDVLALRARLDSIEYSTKTKELEKRIVAVLGGDPAQGDSLVTRSDGQIDWDNLRLAKKEN